jgi:hypothetical protein
MSGFSPSTTVSLAAAEPLLVAVIGLLVLVVAGLIAMAIFVRRRSRPEPAPMPDHLLTPPSTELRPAPRPRHRSSMVRRGGGGGGLAIATSTAMVCPTCRTEYHGMTYCTRDARRLVPPEEMLATARSVAAGGSAKSQGLVCMACRRAYEPGLRSCPHDGNELVPFPVYNATRPRAHRNSTEPSGVLARICPMCGTKYDLNARFCGHDPGELVVNN